MSKPSKKLVEANGKLSPLRITQHYKAGDSAFHSNGRDNFKSSNIWDYCIIIIVVIIIYYYYYYYCVEYFTRD
jgi:hypothetical protein